jgi:hypothetical protein
MKRTAGMKGEGQKNGIPGSQSTPLGSRKKRRKSKKLGVTCFTPSCCGLSPHSIHWIRRHDARIIPVRFRTGPASRRIRLQSVKGACICVIFHDQTHPLKLCYLLPDADNLGRKPAVREGIDKGSMGVKNSCHIGFRLAEHPYTQRKLEVPPSGGALEPGPRF